MNIEIKLSTYIIIKNITNLLQGTKYCTIILGNIKDTIAIHDFQTQTAG